GQVAAPLTALTSVKTCFKWSGSAQGAFDLLKERFTSAPILVTPDVTRQFIVEVDASEVGVGAILSQRSQSDDKVHPCAYFSHRLSPSERNYDVGNRELLAIRLALGEWRQWLEGATVPFVV
ncbi:ribonuclease H family protein, partial [Shigella sonnei]|uniref:ribonuclease H family protein n=1 Tax=Shigella sonnei TaxID=624 RepID=UPI00339188C6